MKVKLTVDEVGDDGLWKTTHYGPYEVDDMDYTTLIDYAVPVDNMGVQLAIAEENPYWEESPNKAVMSVDGLGGEDWNMRLTWEKV